jgi:hypothetical protein
MLSQKHTNYLGIVHMPIHVIVLPPGLNRQPVFIAVSVGYGATCGLGQVPAQ